MRETSEVTDNRDEIQQRRKTNSMQSLNKIPNELHMAIVGHLCIRARDQDTCGGPGFSALSCLSRTCRFFYDLVSPILYKEGHERHPGLLYWATEVGNIGAMEKLLVAANADPNLAFSFEDEIFKWPNHPAKWKRGSSSSRSRWNFYRLISGPSAGLAWNPRGEDDYDLWDFMREYELRNERNSFLYPLHLAAIHGDIRALDLLLAHGALIDVPSGASCSSCDGSKREEYFNSDMDIFGSPRNQEYPAWTPFHFSLCMGHDEVAKHILDIDPTAHERFQDPGDDGEPPMPAFISALRHNRLELAHSILSEGINDVHLEYTGTRFGTLLWWAYWEDVLEHALPILLLHGADIDVDLGDGHTLLIEMCCKGDYDEAIPLIKAGADIGVVLKRPARESVMNETNRFSVSQRDRHLYVSNGHWDDWKKYDYANEPDLESRGQCLFLGLQPIEICCQPYYYENGPSFIYEDVHHPPDPDFIIEALLQASPHRQPSSNPICIAARYHDWEVVKLLLDYGLDVNATDSLGRTPLMQAIRNARGLFCAIMFQQTVEAIVGYAQAEGVLLRHSEKAMLRASQLFLNNTEVFPVVTALMDYGVSINVRNEKNKTPLILAFERRSIVAGQVLLTLGAGLGQSTTRRGRGLPDYDLEFLWSQLLWRRGSDGQPYHDIQSFLFLSKADSRNRLICDRYFWDAANKAERFDVTDWIEWLIVFRSQMSLPFWVWPGKHTMSRIGMDGQLSSEGIAETE